MPPTRTGANTPSTRSKSNLVNCTCDICCADWDPQVQPIKGRKIPCSTRDSHRKDQREQKSSSSVQPLASSSSGPAIHNPGPFVQTPAITPLLGPQPAPGLQVIPHVSDSLWLTSIADELKRLTYTPLVDPHRPLVFTKIPSPSTPFTVDIISDLERPNCSEFSLTRASPNKRFLRAENQLSEIYHLVVSLNINGDGLVDLELLDEIKVVMGRICHEKHRQWNQQSAGSLGVDPHHVNTDIFFYRGHPQSHVYRAVVLSALVSYHIYSAPRRAIAAQLAGMQSILRSLNIPKEQLQYPLPRDPRTTTAYYNLHPITQKYISCPKCHYLYPWNGEQMDDPLIPKHCKYQAIRQPNHPICDAELWKVKRLSGLGNTLGARIRHVPIRTYTHQPLKYWLGRLLSRQGIEDHIEKAMASSPSTNGVMKDIWDSPTLHSLKDHHGNPFLVTDSEEGRLIFSLAVDSFNPNHVKAAHQTTSSTGIWLVLLNLPAHLRYLHQNMYIAGVIPGPNKPSLEELNHYMDLVVNDLLEFYNPGVRFSRTFKYPNGRVFKAMIIPLISDMLASRQVIGQSAAPSSHNFCTACDIDQDDINIIDRTYWPPKDPAQIREYAELWRDAPSQTIRQQSYSATGIRWSPMFRLPYWEPAKYTVVDAMHTLDLGLFQTHCREIFALDVASPSGDGSCPEPQVLPSSDLPYYSDNFKTNYRLCFKRVIANPDELEKSLLKIPRPVLYKFCSDNGITSVGRDIVIGTSWILARSIKQWRESDRYITPSLPSPMAVSGARHPSGQIPSQQPVQPDARSESDRASTPQSEDTAEKSLLPVIRILLQPTDENIAKLKNKATVKIYITLCELLGLNISHIDPKKRSTKQTLQTLILTKVQDNPDVRERLKGFLPPEPVSTPSRVVLGADVMGVVWQDMKKTQTPSWVATAPPNWGTTERGKLSAAQWRVVCTIHLVVTLIRLWHNEEGRKRLLLDHFMDLVSAVRIANMKVTTPAQIDAYNQHIYRYVANISKLYPDQHLKPTHHLALHIGDFLESLGPTHSHNSPYFERNINFFHVQNVNLHPGESDVTLLDSATIHGNLRGLLDDNEHIRPLVYELVERMDKIDKEDIRGFRLASILDPSQPANTLNSKGTTIKLSALHSGLWRDYLAAQDCNLPDNVLQGKVTRFSQIAIQGVRYSTTQHLPSDSVIMFSESAINRQDFSLPVEYESLKAGFVDMIFQPVTTTKDRSTSSTQPSEPSPLSNQFFLLVRELAPAQSTQSRDPYKRYGAAGGFLCCKDQETLRVISLDQVKSHAAITEVSIDVFGEVYHILCVDRLMNIFTAFDVDQETEEPSGEVMEA
ncbi:hypothetical protein CVT24_007406 [Panaeolus cyanescens]|uniref:Uncharacterized protein n=1 Tax=Panaeolus cyanescens TaxID=181874 RepID=A0A409WLC5_9AGAR|nr:hypothetical protein CVT24_007406 [Panaeolus cyanescens]